jgi:hypothetical protein
VLQVDPKIYQNNKKKTKNLSKHRETTNTKNAAALI